MRKSTYLVLSLTILSIILLPECRAQNNQTNVAANERQETASPAPSQITVPTTNASAFIPIIPVLIDYEFALMYFMQPLPDNPTYSMIEASVLSEKPQIYQVALTDKQSKRRTVYCNSEARVKSLKRNGQDARLAQITMKTQQSPDSPAPTYEFALTDSQGQSIGWRFTLASQASERGAGLTALGAVPGLKINYRGNGTTAAEGTAVQIGTKVSEVEPWPEISAPPYFFGFHGFYTERLDDGAIMPGSDSWRIVSSPKDLAEGAVWVLANDRKDQRQFRISTKRGDEMTITEVNDSPNETSTLSLIVKATPQGLLLRAINVAFASRNFRVTFKPALPMMAGASALESTFTIDVGDHQKVSEGTVSVAGDPSGLRLRWQPKSPDWAKSHVFTSTIKIDATGYSLAVQ